MAAIFPRPAVGLAYSPYHSQVRNISHQDEYTEKPPRIRSDRVVMLGDMLDPDSGGHIGPAWLALSEERGSNVAINVFGPSGTGKSVLMRRLIEYFSMVEGRCVIIIDPTKNQYWALSKPQDRPAWIKLLHTHREEPTSIPEVDVYIPIYDYLILKESIYGHPWHANKTYNIKTSSLTPRGFFELGDIDPSGRFYQIYLEEILNIRKDKKTIEYIRASLEELSQDRSRARSILSILNLFNPMCNLKIIDDKGTDLADMLHEPHPGKPGKVSVLSLGTSPVNDRRRNAMVTSICQQLFEYTRENRDLGPVFVLDETKQFAPRSKTPANEATIAALSTIHLQTRAWDVTRVYGFQNPTDVQDWLLGGNTPIQIQMTKTLPLRDGRTKLFGAGHAHVFVEGTGDDNIEDHNFICRALPCKTKHVD